jgi:exopolysaccharide production protein ExoZ
MANSKLFFPGIQALRAVAATLVVIEHAAYVANDYSLLQTITIIPHFYYGRIGVILFFAISGFVIALQRNKPTTEFVAHRLLRIYPSYWLAMMVAALTMLWTNQPVSIGPASALLYPAAASEGTLAIPYWTLAFEMTFYALATAAFALRLRDSTLTIIALLWIAAVNIFASDPANSDAYAFPGFPRILLCSAVQVFPMGLICGILFSKFRLISRWVYLAAACAAFVASFPFAELSTMKLFLLGVSASCLVIAVADLDAGFRVVTMLGNASYGIYLLHFPAMLFAAAIAPSPGFAWLLLIGMTGGTLFGLFDHWLYRQMIDRLVTRASLPVPASKAAPRRP